MAIAHKPGINQWQQLKIAVLCIGLSVGALSSPAIAVNDPIEFLRNEPVNLRLLQPANVPTDGSIVTMHTMSQTNMTIPSLWWAQEQFWW
ncbi:MAG: hypothetical protein HC881_16705 [Leptolyngbyaceae cyanobacterium SL_7_1]|nr:hypothetical protein [Leptolyngbyaceae cyanobacterium SL_7_1]